MAGEGDRLRRLASAHAREVERALLSAARFDRGDQGEASVRELLAPLEVEGWRSLHRRQWPGTRSADIDHLLIGPGGVVVLDTKNWRGHIRLASGRLFREQDDASDALEGLLAQISAVENVMSEAGLAPLEVTGSLVLVGHPIAPTVVGRAHVVGDRDLLRWLRARGQRLHPDTIADLASRAEQRIPPARSDIPVVPVARAKPRARVPEGQSELFDAQELDLDELERASLLPLEQWMVYLHPAQLDVVRRRYNGPCRIRGAAGCGKTVVALHRAAYLAAQEPGDLLFLTYVKTLPRVMATLYERLSPHTVGRVQFSGIHALAMSLVRGAGVRIKIDPRAADSCFHRAWANVAPDDLERQGLPLRYWQEEVRSVIKGRGLQEFDEYRGLARTGRRTRLSAEQRRQVWDLYVEYQELLDASRIDDFEDLIAKALDVAERGAAPSYRFVVVDEAQDLDLLSVRLAAALVSDPRDGLTLVGDGQQAIFPGGYTLKEAGLTLAGRSTILEINYRNTRQVLEAAREVVRSDDFDDLEDVGESGDRPVTVLRDGAAVLSVEAANPHSADVALVQRLIGDLAAGLSAAGAAVLCRTNADAARLRTLLLEAGIPVADLVLYDGHCADAILVGTVKRAKGLEFDRVYLPRVDAYLTADRDAEPERVQRERRELFVAMTRARHGLWTSRID